MIYITGDCHQQFTKLGTRFFPEQKDMTGNNNYVIVTGDFGGIWSQECDAGENFLMNWLNDKPFYTLFVDGNHENFNRLLSDEFPEIDMFGNKVKRIRDKVLYLQRGRVYEIDGKRIFTFGGARSHDIQDGILRPSEFSSKEEYKAELKKWRGTKRFFRIENISWWEQEMPTETEMEYGLAELEKVNFEVDYIITHCCPTSIQAIIGGGTFVPDQLTNYFDRISREVKFNRWFFGHYHNDFSIMYKYLLLYYNVERIN